MLYFLEVFYLIKKFNIVLCLIKGCVNEISLFLAEVDTISVLFVNHQTFIGFENNTSFDVKTCEHEISKTQY